MTNLLLILIVGLNISSGQSYQIYKGDTINFVDPSSKKQGHWIYFGNMKNLAEYKPDQKVEEGDYMNNRKSGLWVKYFPDGKVENEITFSGNRPNGPYKIYYPNGQIQEQGVWKNNRNIGNFVRYYENGNPQQEFDFNKSGKREGHQKYYHENGQVMIEGDWNGGKESGELKEYYANGDLKAVKYFSDGSIEPEKTKAYEPQKPVVEIEKKKEPVKVAPAVSAEEKPNIGFFNGTGFTSLYNKNRQISKKGEFKNGKLIDGEIYRYDKDGILESIEIYKDGKYTGQGVIQDD